MWEQSDNDGSLGTGAARTRVLPRLEGTYGSPGVPLVQVQPTGRRGPGGSRSPGAPKPAPDAQPQASRSAARGKRGRAGEGGPAGSYLSSQGAEQGEQEAQGAPGPAARPWVIIWLTGANQAADRR